MRKWVIWILVGAAIVAVYVLIALLASPTFAQEPSIAEQALGDQLVQEMQMSVRVRRMLIETQRKLSEAEAKIKALEAKPDEKK